MIKGIYVLILLGGPGSFVSEAVEKDSAALFQLARDYETGTDSIAADTVKSISLYREAADMGYAPARNYLGFKYYKGEGVKQDVDSALYWIRSAAIDGDVTAAANLGYLYTEGTDVTHDELEAEKWLTIAAEAGIPGAQHKLVEIKRPVWIEMPVDSLLDAGRKYYLGRAPILGAEMLEIAAQKGDSKAMALMGDAYSKGRGVPYNHNKSVEYFYKAALNGDASAQFIIAETLEIFPDVLKDSGIEEGETIRAEYWYEKASEQDIADSDAAYLLLYSIP